ncbi:unnamed protein product [Linum trigynum]|uniref:Uncharacterized protein n=1 Tax=Linum trigynum TaxID=586398 RepID=A0AAV2FCU5_9ROSI
MIKPSSSWIPNLYYPSSTISSMSNLVLIADVVGVVTICILSDVHRTTYIYVQLDALMKKRASQTLDPLGCCSNDARYFYYMSQAPKYAFIFTSFSTDPALSKYLTILFSSGTAMRSWISI